MIGFRFEKFSANDNRTPFERLLDIFLQILVYTSGNVYEALDWMNQLDQEYKLTNDEYGMGDFIEDLKKVYSRQ